MFACRASSRCVPGGTRRLHADPQGLGDLLRGLTFRDELQDFALAGVSGPSGSSDFAGMPGQRARDAGA